MKWRRRLGKLMRESDSEIASIAQSLQSLRPMFEDVPNEYQDWQEWTVKVSDRIAAILRNFGYKEVGDIEGDQNDFGMIYENSKGKRVAVVISYNYSDECYDSIAVARWTGPTNSRIGDHFNYMKDTEVIDFY